MEEERAPCAGSEVTVTAAQLAPDLCSFHVIVVGHALSVAVSMAVLLT